MAPIAEGTRAEADDAADAFDAADSIASSAIPSPSGSPTKNPRLMAQRPQRSASPMDEDEQQRQEELRQKRKRDEQPSLPTTEAKPRDAPTAESPSSPAKKTAHSPKKEAAPKKSDHPPQAKKHHGDEKQEEEALPSGAVTPPNREPAGASRAHLGTPITLREQMQGQAMGYSGAPSMPASVLSSPAKRVFGSTGGTAPTAATKPHSFAALLEASVKNLDAKQKASGSGGTTTPIEGGDGEDQDAEEENTAEFQPVVHLTKLQNLKSGEEDETNMASCRAKLYVLDAATKGWKERGTGQLKVLQHKQEPSKVRLCISFSFATSKIRS